MRAVSLCHHITIIIIHSKYFSISGETKKKTGATVDQIWKEFCHIEPMTSKVQLACIAGGISVGVLYCFGGGAVRRVGLQVILKSRLRQFLGILKSPQPSLPPKETFGGALRNIQKTAARETIRSQAYGGF